MTRQQAKQLLNNIPVLAAYAEGKTIQFRHSEGCSWADISNPNWVEGTEYRIKPEPRTAPWDSPEDVPMPVCWVRNRKWASCVKKLVQQVIHTGVCTGDASYIDFAGIEDWEYSTDGINFKPCTKEVL